MTIRYVFLLLFETIDKILLFGNEKRDNRINLCYLKSQNEI